ncbi:MAG: TOBE domain-containing protein, partial [Thermoplasmatales archaeon]|nr:TOBE domain-containing protein [Thermoplasmatales archaeon]
VNNGNGPNLKIGETTVDLDLSGLSMPSGVQSMDVSLGIRPEDVKIVERGLNGKVVVTQNLGKSKIEHIQLSGSNAEVIRMTGVESDLDSGQSVSIMPNESKFYIFDSLNEKRIWPLTG